MKLSLHSSRQCSFHYMKNQYGIGEYCSLVMIWVKLTVLFLVCSLSTHGPTEVLTKIYCFFMFQNGSWRSLEGPDIDPVLSCNNMFGQPLTQSPFDHFIQAVVWHHTVRIKIRSSLIQCQAGLSCPILCLCFMTAALLSQKSILTTAAYHPFSWRLNPVGTLCVLSNTK